MSEASGTSSTSSTSGASGTNGVTGKSKTDLGFTYRFVPAQQPGLPTLLLLHGTGGDENDLIPLGELLLPGAALLSPRGKVLEHGMPRFFRRLAEGVFDLDDLRFRTDELAEFVGQAARAEGFDAGRVVAAGFSNGANIALTLLLQRPGVLAGAALFSPMVTLEPEPLPRLDATPVFIGAGKLDPIAPPDHPQRLQDLFTRAGAQVTVYWQPGGHALTTDEVRAATEWLKASGLA